jgi:large subunit ribosomal protein L25
MTSLQSDIRTTGKDLSQLRAAGKIPAVIYGAGITESIHISIDREAFKKAWKAAGGSTTVTITADGKKYDTLIHDFQIDPVTDIVVHADFLALDNKAKITVGVELEFVGISPAVKAGAGTLEKMIHEIEVEGLPKDLPKSIEVDISSLANVHDQIHVRDLKLPSGIELKTDADDTIAVITGLQEETEEAPTSIDFDAIQVEQKGKKEDEAEAESAD